MHVGTGSGHTLARPWTGDTVATCPMATNFIYPRGYIVLLVEGETMSRIRALLAVLLGLSAIVLSACGAQEQMEIRADTIVIDVRTPEEYGSGHLDGAVNIDVNSGVFAEQIATLDPAGDYVVYCRSGNRSAQAVKIMEGLGFEEVRDAGGVNAAADATGLEIVTN